MNHVSYPMIKRGIDVAISLGLIVLLTPVWLLATLAVKLNSAGPILFTQPRGGRGCQPFTLYKFRTMRSDHVHDPTEIVPLSHSGITTIGRVLRRTKVDELPQLFNVLIGDMSIVGPRPTIMDQVVRYNDFQRRRQDVRPGITGLAQINGGAILSWEERIKYDVYYVDHLTLGMDLMILAHTLKVVLWGEARYVRPFAASPYARRG